MIQILRNNVYSLLFLLVYCSGLRKHDISIDQSQKSAVLFLGILKILLAVAFTYFSYIHRQDSNDYNGLIFGICCIISVVELVIRLKNKQ